MAEACFYIALNVTALKNGAKNFEYQLCACFNKII